MVKKMSSEESSGTSPKAIRFVSADDFVGVDITSAIKKEWAEVAKTHDRAIILERPLWEGYIEAEDRSEHELTREHISDRFDKLDADVAKKDDLIRTQEEIISAIKSESQQIQSEMENQIHGLQARLVRFLPYKSTFRTSFYLLISLVACLFVKVFLGVTIIESFWAMVGIIISAGFLIMSCFMCLDWKKSIHSHE